MGTPEEDEEHEHFHRIVNAFRFYGASSLQRVSKTEAYFQTLPDHHRKLLTEAGYSTQFEEIRTCIENNDEIIKHIIKDVSNMFENVENSSPIEQRKTSPQPIPADMAKVQGTLKQLVRDWSEEGEPERTASYQPIIDEIVANFPASTDWALNDVKVLVPGAGLGRLAFEIALRGYQCQGNEFSLFMLFASNFVLNKCRGRNSYRVHPWVHQYNNNLCTSHQTHAVAFPDINPADLPADAHFSMAAGDFLEVYTEEGEWDCVATCFFIDCARNVIEFIETIFTVLKPGGIWINLGPLLYHFSDMDSEDSIEPSYEAIRHIVTGIGFVMEKEETNVKTTYAQNPNSIHQHSYDSVFFVCRKPLPQTVDQATQCDV